MKNIKFILIGILFGIVLSKAEVISWYRIYEMFKFESFHMYGVIGSAIAIGIVLMQLFKKGIIKNYLGEQILIKDKKKQFIRVLLGGTIFGFGWALAGACPGPIFILIGYGAIPVLVVLFGTVLGAFVYGLINKKLPH